MNELIINEIAKDLNVKVKQVETVLNLLSDGNTIPFIARYRKEATGCPPTLVCPSYKWSEK